MMSDYLARLQGIVAALMGQRDALIEQYAAMLTVSTGRRDGRNETRASFDRLLPSLIAAESDASPFDTDDSPPVERARWRMRTSRAGADLSQYGLLRGRPDVLAAYHGANAEKGRRIAVSDQDNGVTAAIAAWHYDEPPARRRTRAVRRGVRRPHLVVSLAVADFATGELRSQYTAMLYHAVVLVAAIDRCTLRRGRIGLQVDSAILLTPDELAVLGWQRGRSASKGGYAGDYREWIYER